MAWGVLKLSGIRVVLEDPGGHLTAHQPCIYVSNHQGALDIAVLGSIYTQRTAVVGKKELLYIPFLGLYFVAARNIVIDRHKRSAAVATLSGAVNAIRERQVSVW